MAHHQDVQFMDQGHHVVLDNGIVRMTISKPGGIITGLRYGGIDNLLEVINKETNRGYWDLNWNEPGGKDNFDVPSATIFNVVNANRDKVEVSFIRPYNPSNNWKMVPLNIDKRFRQYGLWERYSEIFHNNDLIYNVESSDWRRDWYFAHTCRIEKDGSFHPATWQVKFQLQGVKKSIVYKLRMSIASSTNAAIQVRFNDANIYKPHFDTMQFGKDNAIARHGIHGLYYLFNIDVSGSLLVEGENTLYLTQRKATSPFTGVMYDYLRLEEVSL